MTALLYALLAGGLASVLIEALIRPRVVPPWRRPIAALLVHLGSWCLLHAGALLLVQRPWFAAILVLSLQLVVIQTNNTKWRSLKEPFLCQDFDYYLDALRHPRLYLPFFGIGLTCAALLAGAATITLFLWLEPWWLSRVSPGGALGLLAAQVVAGAVLLGAGLGRLPSITLVPEHDLPPLGLYAYLWRYAIQARRALDAGRSPAGFRYPPPADADALPDVVVVQSESFFDPRRWSSHVDPVLLATWDRLAATSLAHGSLHVPAWGANTVRTEAAFLTGLEPDALGMHRFNPYRQLAHQDMPNLLKAVKQMGYRTVALHPWPASFYLRDRVLPRLGIDHFLDLDAFDPADRDGQYIGDAALARQVARLLGERADRRPLFLFVITMENHGPLHLEAPRQGDERRLAPPVRAAAGEAHYRDLLVYLRHLDNADRMLATLSQILAAGERPGLLCWYGDHVPIMDQTFRHLGEPSGTTDYLVWSSRYCPPQATPPVSRHVASLGVALLEWIIAHSAGHPAGHGCQASPNMPDSTNVKKDATPRRRHQEQE